jgi:hypothetical protein
MKYLILAIRGVGIAIYLVLLLLVLLMLIPVFLMTALVLSIIMFFEFSLSGESGLYKEVKRDLGL